MNIQNPQIFITAVITVCFSTIFFGGLFFSIGPRQKKYFWFLLIMLPCSALVNLWVKAPLNQLVLRVFYLQSGLNFQQPVLYLLFLTFLAPVTEELIKIFPLLVPSVRKLMDKNALWVGVWMGLGFGLGEAIYLAYGISLSNQYADLPWYAFGGYISERMIVCLIHAVLTGIFVRFIYQKKFFVGYGLVILLHFFVNIGAFFLAMGVIKPIVANIQLIAMVLVLVYIFEKIRAKETHPKESGHTSQEVVYFRRSD